MSDEVPKPKDAEGFLGGSTNGEAGVIERRTGLDLPAGDAKSVPGAVAAGAVIAGAEPRGPDRLRLPPGVGGVRALEDAMHEAMDERQAMELLKEAHAKAQELWTALLFLKQRDAMVLVRPDTAFALGEATGMAAKAKALLGRDLDDRVRALVLAQDAGPEGGDGP